MAWYRFVDTSLDVPDDIAEPGAEVQMGTKKSLAIGDRATIILIGR